MLLRRREFPDVPWQTYLDEIKSLGEVLQSIPVEQPHPVAVSSPLTVLSHVRGIASRQPIDVCQPKAA